VKRRAEEGAEIRQPRVEVEDKVQLIESSTDCWPPPTAEVVAVKLLPVEEARRGSADGVEAIVSMKNCLGEAGARRRWPRRRRRVGGESAWEERVAAAVPKRRCERPGRAPRGLLLC
jgi:hypothetical protein